MIGKYYTLALIVLSPSALAADRCADALVYVECQQAAVADLPGQPNQQIGMPSWLETSKVTPDGPQKPDGQSNTQSSIVIIQSMQPWDVDWHLGFRVPY